MWALKLWADVPIHLGAVPTGGDPMSQTDAFRTCPYCAAEDVPKLVVYPRLVAGTSTSWKCRSCDQYWSDAQTVLLRAS
jgi:hypothetical protein